MSQNCLTMGSKFCRKTKGFRQSWWTEDLGEFREFKFMEKVNRLLARIKD